ncbi:uncharacterized protein LOC143074576 [Mytilus galloprovincialis]|uniref:uncharacterized protein LOC143074576 n=1 Tax=Mytilus galloprovincialis TaxID=29158 RepID=UPI003F7CB65B
MLDRQKVTYNIAGEGKRSQVKLTDAKQWKTNVASGSSELNYIEVEFGFEQPTGNYFIHGADNRTPYADIDFLAKAEPLISSDEDDESIAGGDDNGDDFMTLEDVQQWNITVD